MGISLVNDCCYILVLLLWLVNLSPFHISAFQQTTPPERLFKDKEFLLTCIVSSQEVHRVFVSGECQAFFESNCDIVKASVDLISA